MSGWIKLHQKLNNDLWNMVWYVSQLKQRFDVRRKPIMLLFSCDEWLSRPQHMQAFCSNWAILMSR